ncbi:MAG: hypothetical protein KGM47_07555, partial [Acidobacteriota bacterium]|nr:hypothetical protein [Acidobacteriota bacterium]
VIVMAWGVHRFRAPAHSLAPAAAQAPLQTAQSPATPPSGNLQQASQPNPAETAETTAPPAASKTSEITGTAAPKQSQNRESASASKKSSAPPRVFTQPAQKQAAPAQTAAVLPPKVTPPPITSAPPANAAVTNPELATVIVSTAPGAQIFVDGKLAGTANSSGRLTMANLAPGSHDLRAALSGFNDIDYSIRVPPGGTSFVSAKWGASQSAAPTQSSPSQTGAGTAKGIAASFPVAYLHTFGSSRGLLVVEGGNVHYQPSDGKGAFFSPLSGISWGSTGGQEFYIRVKGGQNYRFRSPEAANILATLRRAVSEQ